ncbi:MAG: ABC transporter substrate-binding protein [Eubacteriales bacterium]|nr:ABC transporter substrate-binding protein [Eubacteriales bacterium]
MKKRLAVILTVMLAAFALAGCGSDSGSDEPAEQAVSEVVNVAVLNGPTGMGAVQLTDMTEKYNLKSYEAPTDIAPKLISGEVDVAALPSNMAAVLFNKTEGQVVAVTPVALGVLYIIGNDADVKKVEDLSGRTIVSSGQGGTPEYALEKILENSGMTPGEDVQVEWLASHADVNQKLLSEPGTIAMVPEPFVSVALAQGGEDGVEVLFDMNNLWKEATGQEFPMGVLVARSDFTQNRSGDLEVLLADLKASVDFVNEGSDEAAQLIVDKGFLGEAAIAKAAIPGCSLVCFTGDQLTKGTEMLKVFNQTMFEMNPESVGGKLPGDELYYQGK